jgi:hypothetical protein
MTDFPPEEPRMEIHKPKPVHNWRELLTEVGVIVIGVAIALAAEQAVEAVHWQGRIRDARRALTVELRDDDGPQAYERLAVEACRNGRLDAIRNAIIAKAKRPDIAQLVARFMPNVPTWDSVAWNTLQTSDVASHVSPEELRSWSLPYTRMPRLESGNLQEHQDWVALQPSELGDEALSAGEAAAMLAAIARLRDDNRFMVSNSRILLSGMVENGVNLTVDQRHRILETQRKRVGDCVTEPNIVVRNVNPFAAIPNRP